MRYYSYYTPLIFLFLLSLMMLATGCASINTWNAIGVETFCVKSIKLERTEKNQVQLTQTGFLRKSYLPFTELFSCVTPHKKNYTYPTNKEIDESLHYDFLLKPEDNFPDMMKSRYGLLLLTAENINYQENKIIKLNRNNLSELLKNPFFFQDTSIIHTGLLIPYHYMLLENGSVLLNAYSPLHPVIINPDSCNNCYTSNINGFPITLWRIILMPVPVAIDVVTMPIQLILLLFLH